MSWVRFRVRLGLGSRLGLGLVLGSGLRFGLGKLRDPTGSFGACVRG